MRFYCTSTGPIGDPNCERLTALFQFVEPGLCLGEQVDINDEPSLLKVGVDWSHRWSQLQGSAVVDLLGCFEGHGIPFHRQNEALLWDDLKASHNAVKLRQDSLFAMISIAQPHSSNLFRSQF